MEGFDRTWEKVHSEKEWGKYPPEELIRFIMGNFKHLSLEERGKIKILELGFGQGANIWFLSREGFDVYGIEGSRSAAEKAAKRLETDKLEAKLREGDFNNLDYYEEQSFDIIIDIVSVECIQQAWKCKRHSKPMPEKLKPEGKIFSMMVAQGSYGDNMGEELESHTFTNIPDGPFSGVGVVHFFSLDEVRNLFSIYNGVNIEYSIRSLYGMQKEVRHWVTSGIK